MNGGDPAPSVRGLQGTAWLVDSRNSQQTANWQNPVKNCEKVHWRAATVRLPPSSLRPTAQPESPRLEGVDRNGWIELQW